MNFEFGLSELIIAAIAWLVSISGTYWKLRISILKRPEFEKVEQMIKRDGVSEKRVEEIVARDAFSKSGGEVLSQKIDSLAKGIDHLTNKIDIKNF